MIVSTTCYLGLGANLPHGQKKPADTIQAAISCLADKALENIKVSGFYLTSPQPASNQPDFVNCVISGETGLSPRELLVCCQEIEEDFGRERSVRWDARTLDIDLLAYGAEVLPAEHNWQELSDESADGTLVGDLVLPHARLHARAFVLVPLCDLAPSWGHPVLQKSATELLDALSEDERAGVRPFSADLS